MKYRILEKDGWFCPQEDVIWSGWTCLTASFKTLEEAKAYLDKITKPIQVIHAYP